MAIGTFSVSSFAFQNEPDGFRGIKWGTNIKTLNGMTEIEKQSKGGLILYVKDNDKLQIGGAELMMVCYSFWQDKFYSVFIQTKKHSNWSALKEVVFAKFGEGERYNKYRDVFLLIESYR